MKKFLTYNQFTSEQVNHSLGHFEADFIGMQAAQLGMSREEYVSHFATPDIGVTEGIMSTLDLIRQESSNLKDFIKRVLADKTFSDMKGDSNFIEYLNSIYESINEDEIQLKKGDKIRFKNGKSIYILGPKGDGYDYSDGREKGHHPKKWFDMMISSKKAIVESINEDENDAPASPEEMGMAQNQLKFIHYAASEIEEYLEGQQGGFPEWLQNKLTDVHSKIRDIHGYIEGERGENPVV